MPHTRGRQARSGRQRKTSWNNFLGTVNTIVPGGAVMANLVSSALTTIAADSTIVRVRGRLSISSADVNPGGAFGSFGAIVVNADAFVVGVTAVPDPISDEADWMIHGNWSIEPTRIGNTDISVAPVYLTIDNKSMRKMNEQFSLLAFKFVNSSSSSMDVRLQFGLRTLVMRQ